ncbi:M20 family metallopeptidase [Nocardia sp. NPDC051570]|uniref:M20 family metallopeptidase n=1 Tax=Nocardia sp. NPDC051570 TaxID=3364324 RepID=UPI003796B5F5
MGPDRLRERVAAAYPGFVENLRYLVDVDCGTWNAQGVGKIADFCAQRLTTLGCTVERLPMRHPDGRPLGDLVIGRRTGRDSAGRRFLLLAHMDTVFENGTVAARPFRVDGAIAYGPGVTDDKAGLLAGLTALRTLVEDGAEPYAELVVVCSPDEEIGAPASRPHIERLAAAADIVLCLECARENGALVQARKGIADIRITVTGRAAHAGIEPERGANAALAAARLVVELQALNGKWPGTTVNVGVINGGTRPNIVCPQVVIDGEVRASTAAGLAAALDEIDRLARREWVPGTRSSVQRNGVVEPMQAAAELVAAAQRVAAGLGFEVGAVSTGGVADANLAAGVGAATLDGLGPVGGGDHSESEWLDLDSIIPRICLLTGLILNLA